MLRKRLIGVVTIRKGLAVQSFGYSRYLPIGKPEVLVENLDRWGVDEILVNCIDRSKLRLGPDFELLRKISRLNISTPMIYSGGISSLHDALSVISLGADRIMVDAMLHRAPEQLWELASALGTQAVIGHIAVRRSRSGLVALDYINGFERLLRAFLNETHFNSVSELMISDYQNEGLSCRFDTSLLTEARDLPKPLILFGGISEPGQVNSLLSEPNVAATGIGNFLCYREHAVQYMKVGVTKGLLRTPSYQSSRQVISE